VSGSFLKSDLYEIIIVFIIPLGCNEFSPLFQGWVEFEFTLIQSRQEQLKLFISISADFISAVPDGTM